MNELPKETLRLIPFELDGKAMVDVRWWKNTRQGPRQTSKAIQIEQSTVTRLISALQKYHAIFNSQEAKKEESYQS